MCELGEKSKINDAFPDEHVVAAFHDLTLWFADFANYMASDIDLLDLSFNQRKKYIHDVKNFFWDEP